MVGDQPGVHIDRYGLAGQLQRDGSHRKYTTQSVDNSAGLTLQPIQYQCFSERRLWFREWIGGHIIWWPRSKLAIGHEQPQPSHCDHAPGLFARTAIPQMTISTTTVTGTSESTTRMLENPSSTDPMRIDYFSMMRKWYVALYRYGLRLTYDITVPEPGAAMREIFAQLTDLQNKVSQNFAFSLDYSAIIPANWDHLSETFQAQLPPPPQALPPQTFGPTAATGLPAPNADDRDWHVFSLPFTVPDGCWITGVTVQATVETGNSGSYTYHYFMVADTGYYDHGATTNYTLDFAGGHYSPPGNPEGGPLLTA